MTAAALMAAMMLPGAVPAAASRQRGRIVFALTYFAIWVVVGLALDVLWPAHGFVVAGIVIVAAAAYELTPFKRECRRRCREEARSGLDFGLNCVGSSIGLMAVLAALGVMSIAWMAAVAGVVVVQKLMPPNLAIDLPLALAIAALGIVVAVEPSLVPGLEMM